MQISMYQASAPRFVHMLNNLSAILDKAQAYADVKKIDAAVLTGFRLFPDMSTLRIRTFTFTRPPSTTFCGTTAWTSARKTSSAIFERLRKSGTGQVLRWPGFVPGRPEPPEVPRQADGGSMREGGTKDEHLRNQPEKNPEEAGKLPHIDGLGKLRAVITGGSVYVGGRTKENGESISASDQNEARLPRSSIRCE